MTSIDAHEPRGTAHPAHPGSAGGRPGPTTRVQVHEHRVDGVDGVDGADWGVRRRADRLVTEEPMEVRCSWPGQRAQSVAVTMRTPGHDFELAAGLLFAEGLATPGSIDSVAYCADLPPGRQGYNTVTLALTGPPPVALPRRGDTVTAVSSACGVCGAESIAAVLDRLDPLPPASPTDPLRVSAGVVHALPEALREHQRVFDRTGGLHAAGLFDRDGRALVVREDVGRHNAVDKVVGHRLLARQAPGADVLAVSGRLGYEITQKAVSAAVPVVVAVGAPSSLSVELAERAGTTLVGFTGSRRFVVYTHPERVV